MHTAQVLPLVTVEVFLVVSDGAIGVKVGLAELFCTLDREASLFAPVAFLASVDKIKVSKFADRETSLVSHSLTREQINILIPPRHNRRSLVN